MLPSAVALNTYPLRLARLTEDRSGLPTRRARAMRFCSRLVTSQVGSRILSHGLTGPFGLGGGPAATVWVDASFSRRKADLRTAVTFADQPCRPVSLSLMLHTKPRREQGDWA
ncbi:hypothetical protein Kisp01_27560 [Kineosporia sp. NBRC 101677]|nr:hypothetical protein Kisp01_27560 [Kineosporia sp. NBRC 101677]